MYLSDITLLWYQPENAENPFVYKPAYFGRSMAMYHKTVENVKNTSIEVLDKVYHQGTIGFQAFFETKDTEFQLRLFYLDSRNHLRMIFRPDTIAMVRYLEG